MSKQTLVNQTPQYLLTPEYMASSALACSCTFIPQHVIIAEVTVKLPFCRTASINRTEIKSARKKIQNTAAPNLLITVLKLSFLPLASPTLPPFSNNYCGTTWMKRFTNFHHRCCCYSQIVPGSPCRPLPCKASEPKHRSTRDGQLMIRMPQLFDICLCES